MMDQSLLGTSVVDVRNIARALRCWLTGLIQSAAIVAMASSAAQAAPLKYYVLAPEHLAGNLSVMSLESGNVITAGTAQLSLAQYDTGTIPAVELYPGLVIQGSKAFVVGSTQSAADLLAPDTFAGTSFIVPHVAGQHKYFILSPSSTAQVTVQLGGNSYNVQANEGVVNEFDAGSDNTIAGRITSDQPIVLAHAAYVSGVARDAYPVPPAATEVVGIRSQNAVVAAATNGTSVTVYASDGASATYTLSAGEKATVAVGASLSQGQGAALRLVSNYPIAAVQYDDGDGSDMTAFWGSSHFGRRLGVPVGAQYLAVACTDTNVSVTLYKGSTSPETQVCSSSGNSPGKVYFGDSSGGAHLGAGWYLISSAPVYLTYEVATSNDEANNLGLSPAAGPASPTLDSVSSPTTSNPRAVTGEAGANQSVRLYVNGRLQATTTANGSGDFSFNAELNDNNNVLYATAVTAGNESDPSNAVNVVFNSTVSHTQSGTISGTVVWTAGNPATPYTITANLTVAAGARLILQPGTTLQFANGTTLVATGELKVAGAPGNPVTLTSGAASPVRGSWVGVQVNGNASSLIEYAVIEYASTGVNVVGVTATVRNNTIRYFSANGVYVTGAGTALVKDNLIDNLNDTANCIYTNAGSPTVQGNTLTNCAVGLRVYGSSAPTVNGNNLITSNAYGVYADGNLTANPAPVVNGNQIFDNTTVNFQVIDYTTSGWTLNVNARNNWWGTSDPVTIEAKIAHRTDDYTNTRLPTVDFSGLLDGPGGTAATNQLLGSLTATATTLSVATYDVLGVLTVPTGKTLTIPAGATLRFHGVNARLIVDGTLSVAGTSGSLAVLTSGKATPARGDWRGVFVRAGAGSVLEYARIDYAETAVNVTGVAATVRNSTIRYFSANGVYLSSAAAGTLVKDNLIDNLNDTADCVEVNTGGSPLLQGNTMTNCSVGVRVYLSATPTFNANNVITDNAYGVYADGNLTTNPAPVVNGNQIFDNTTVNFQVIDYTTSGWTLNVNARNNWWGTSDPALIQTKITDLTDDYTNTRRPTVDYSNFLDGPNGTPVAGNHLIGPLTAISTTLTAATYDVLGVTVVPAGKTLTIPAGATLRFHGPTTRLVVDGTLTVQGTSGNQVVFTSGKAVPARGDWEGILLRAGTGSVVEYARLEYAITTVQVAGVAATVRNNTIRYFSANGVYVSGAATGTLIKDNLIDNVNDTVDCVETYGSSPTLQGNTLTNCSVGLRVYGSSAPTVNGNNVITSNTYGVYADGNLTTNPAPVVNGNQIFDNTTVNFQVIDYTTSGWTLNVNARNNWWGTSDPVTIEAKIAHRTDDYTSTRLPTVDFSGLLDGPGGTAAVNQLLGSLTASATTLTAATYDVLGVLTVPTGKTLTVPAGATLRFHGVNARLIVDGTLSVSGTSGTLAVLTSGKAVPARGDWAGVLVRAGTGSVVEYARIEYAVTGVNVTGVNATVRNNTIRYFSTNGVYVSGAGAAGTLVKDNLIDNLNDTANCINTDGSSPTLQGNTLTNCSVGVRVYLSSAPVINGNNVITSNGYGVFADGNLTANPAPVVNGNQIFDNATVNFQVIDYTTSGWTLNVNARNNWWGTSDPVTIEAKIAHRTDDYTNTRLPTVDWSGVLDGPGGTAATNQLLGSLTATATTLSVATYDVLGVLTVPTGKTLTIPAGATLRFHGVNARLIVDGTLSVSGTSGTLAVLTSGKATPARGDWAGVLVRAGTGSVVEYARIEYAVTGVDVTGVTATVRNNTIRYFSANGVYVTGAGTALVKDNLIDNLNDTANCIYTNAGSPTVQGNTLTNCAVGLRVYGSSAPTVNGNNLITSNAYGVYADGNLTANPAPVVNGNQIFDNTTVNFQVIDYTTSGWTLNVNARNNWWGTSDPVTIEAKIAHRTDDYTNTRLPTVDFSGLLDGPGGTAATNQLLGSLTATATTLSVATYDVLGVLTVPTGKTLTIPAGATLRFHGVNARLIVDGTLSVAGTAAAKVRFTSASAAPTRGSWPGILIRSSATSVVIDSAEIEWAARAIEVQTTTAIIRNSLIRNFSDDGIRMTSSGTASQITGNYVDNLNKTGECIVLTASSPLVSGNRLHRCDTGLYMSGASAPTVSGNIITDNNQGIVLEGSNSNSATAVPNPVMTGNDVFGNALAQLEVRNYGSSNPIVINATGNWWGTTTPTAGQQIKFTSGSPVTAVNFTSAASAPLNGTTAGNVTVSEPYISPNGDGVKEQTTIQGTLSQSSSWTLAIKAGNGSVVRSYTGTGTTLSAVWDGTNGSGQLQPDGEYWCEVSVPGSPNPITVGVNLAVLDNTLPLAVVSIPTPSAVLQNVIANDVQGTVSDTHLVSYTLEYGAGATPSSWVTIQSQTSGVSAGVLGTWTVGSTNGSFALANGPYALRLRATDLAGNANATTVPVTLDNISISGVTQNLQLIRPLQSETLQVSFALSDPATAYLRIYPEQGGALVREVSQSFASAGAKTLAWDARNTSGNYVVDEAYTYVLVIDDGTRTSTYDLPIPDDGIGSGTGAIDASHNPSKNDFWKMNYSLSALKGRVRMQVSGCGIPGTHLPYDWVPFVPGVTPLIWDGRNQSGAIVAGACSVYFDAPRHLKPNSVIVRGTRPAISGTGVSPNIEVKSNPYRATHSFEQVSTITYRVDQDSYVTVKLLPPGISDPASPQAIVLVNNELQSAQSGGAPLNHEVEWKGFEDADTNNILVAGEGTYTFTIQATSVATSLATLYRGALQLWQ